VIKAYIENEVVIDPFEWEYFIKNLDVKEEVRQKYSMTMLLNGYKNGSLYADFDEGEFLKPSEKINKETCEYGITLAYMQKKFIEAPNFHKDGLYLYKFKDDHEKKIKVLQEKYLEYKQILDENHSKK
jgi:hypothetical protein